MPAKATCKGYFLPSAQDPMVCRWWLTPPWKLETTVEPFCCCTMRLGKECPTAGRNPYPQEEDSFD